jgi:hypothetical protein
VPASIPEHAKRETQAQGRRLRDRRQKTPTDEEKRTEKEREGESAQIV